MIRRGVTFGGYPTGKCVSLSTHFQKFFLKIAGCIVTIKFAMILSWESASGEARGSDRLTSAVKNCTLSELVTYPPHRYKSRKFL